jgi:GNAT superfamily N-acetyltransferase
MQVHVPKTSPPHGVAAGRQSKLAAMEGGEITVREALPGDAEALEVLHADVAQYYDRGVPQPADEALAADGVALRLVAEVDGEIVGVLAAKLTGGENGYAHEPEAAEKRLLISYLATAADRRRTGIGTRLVETAEEWGRRAGATVAETNTFQGSPLSVPFWEDRMGYEELATSLEKRL